MEHKQQPIGIKRIKTAKQSSEKGNKNLIQTNLLENSNPRTNLKYRSEVQCQTRFEYQSCLSDARTTCNRWPHFIGKCAL